MLKCLSSAILVLAVGSSTANAVELSDGKIVLNEVVRGTLLAFEPVFWPKDAHGVVLTVEGPGDYAAMVETGGKIPAIYLDKFGDVKDGLYAYEITGGTSEKIKRVEKVDNGRDKDRGYDVGSFALSGILTVDRGKIVDFNQAQEVGSEKPIAGDPKPDDFDEGPTKPLPVKDGPTVDDSDRGDN